MRKHFADGTIATGFFAFAISYLLKVFWPELPTPYQVLIAMVGGVLAGRIYRTL